MPALAWRTMPGAQHQLMRNDLRFFWRLAQDRQKKAGKAHGGLVGRFLGNHRHCRRTMQEQAQERGTTTAMASYLVLNGGATWRAWAHAAERKPGLAPGSGAPVPSFTIRKNSLWRCARGVTQGRALTTVCAIKKGASPLAVQRAPQPKSREGCVTAYRVGPADAKGHRKQCLSKAAALLFSFRRLMPGSRCGCRQLSQSPKSIGRT